MHCRTNDVTSCFMTDCNYILFQTVAWSLTYVSQRSVVTKIRCGGRLIDRLLMCLLFTAESVGEKMKISQRLVKFGARFVTQGAVHYNAACSLLFCLFIDAHSKYR